MRAGENPRRIRNQTNSQSGCLLIKRPFPFRPQFGSSDPACDLGCVKPAVRCMEWYAKGGLREEFETLDDTNIGELAVERWKNGPPHWSWRKSEWVGSEEMNSCLVTCPLSRLLLCVRTLGGNLGTAWLRVLLFKWLPQDTGAIPVFNHLVCRAALIWRGVPSD